MYRQHKCPYCDNILSDTEIGVRSHLTKHANEGKILSKDVGRIGCEIRGEKYIDRTGN